MCGLEESTGEVEGGGGEREGRGRGEGGGREGRGRGEERGREVERGRYRPNIIMYQSGCVSLCWSLSAHTPSVVVASLQVRSSC